MKPLPDLTDTEDMLKRGRLSALYSAEREAKEALRDACTRMQSAAGDDMLLRAEEVEAALKRLKDIRDMHHRIGDHQ